MRKKIRQEESFMSISPMDNWKVTFSDIVTLLMTFFVMIVAMSSLNEKTVMKRLSLGKDAVAKLNLAEKAAIPSARTVSSAIILDRIRLALPEDERRFFISESERGTVLAIPASVIFEQGTGKLNKDASRYLHAVASSLAGTDNFISIEGHVPASGNIGKDSRLSLGMAASVLDYFIYESGLSPSRFSIAGYGGNRPPPGKDGKAYALNDGRLEIVFLKIKPYEDKKGEAS